MKKISKILAISALALTTIPTNVFAVSETAGVKVNIQETLSLTINEESLNFLLDDSNLHIDSLLLTASTNAVGGYTISFNANNDYNDLKHSNALVEDLIPSITEDVTETTFPETGWAYSTDLESYTFKQIPLEAENIFATTEKGENTHEFTVGTRSKSDLAAGDYENELIFTAVANPEPIPTLSDIDNMQQMTSEICTASAINETKQLVDTRDGKKYWVAKLADENCWMTQNLDLDLDKNTTLTPSDTNIATNWTPANSTATVIADFHNSNIAPYSFDPGDYYMNNVIHSARSCDYISGTCGNFSTSMFESGEEHGHIGNYYNFSAAVAQNDTSSYTTNGVSVETSICPKGWRLPRADDTTGDEIMALGNRYGFSRYQDHDDALITAPLYFVRGGALTENGFYGHDFSGYYQFSTVLSDEYARTTDFSSTYPYVAVTERSRVGGHLVRCRAI